MLDLVLGLGGAEGLEVALRTTDGTDQAFIRTGRCGGEPSRLVAIVVDGLLAGHLHLHGRSELDEVGADAFASLIGKAVAAQLNDRNSRIRHQLSVLLEGTRTPRSRTDLEESHAVLGTFLEVLATASPSCRAGIDLVDEPGAVLESMLGGQSATCDVGQRRVAERMSIDGRTIAELVLVVPEATPVLTREYDHKLLRHAASNLGAILSFGAAAVTSAIRDTLFGELLAGFDALHAEIYKMLQGSAPLDDMLDAVFETALGIAERTIPDASIFDVRWTKMAHGSEVLWFRSCRGDAWNDLDDRLRHRTYSLWRADRTSKGAKVFETGKSELVLDVHTDPEYVETFPGVVSMIIAPIRVGDPEAVPRGSRTARQGVLDVRSEREPLGELDLEIAEAIGRQLGLISHLIVSIHGSRSARADLERVQAEQLRATEDLRHQLLGPISGLERRTRRLLNMHPQDISPHRLFAIRGLARKSFNVTRALRCFVDLARGQALSISAVPFSGDDVARLLEHAAQDAEIVARQPVHMYVDSPSVRAAVRGLVHLDRELFEQAIASLLDNAGKYGLPGSDVEVRGDYVSTRDEFVVAVRSRGQRLRPADVDKCKERGWRGANQRGEIRRSEVAGEGSGIGLWIVDQILLAHGGRLVVAVDGPETDVRMCFPATKSERANT